MYYLFDYNSHYDDSFTTFPQLADAIGSDYFGVLIAKWESDSLPWAEKEQWHVELDSYIGCGWVEGDPTEILDELEAEANAEKYDEEAYAQTLNSLRRGVEL